MIEHTVHFFGPSASQSAANRLFPAWNNTIGAKVRLVSHDTSGHRLSATEILRFLQSDPQFIAAVFTGHKVEMAQNLSPYRSIEAPARDLNQVGGLLRIKQDLHAFSQDVCASAPEIDSILGCNGAQFRRSVILGAGGAGRSIAYCLQRKYPQMRVAIYDVDEVRLNAASHILERTGCRPVALLHQADVVEEIENPGVFLVNATGVGKEEPGLVLTSPFRFDKSAIYWDLNYRGTLDLLQKAKVETSEARNGGARDGWSLFLRSWHDVLSRVAIALGATPPTIDEVSFASDEVSFASLSESEHACAAT